MNHAQEVFVHGLNIVLEILGALAVAWLVFASLAITVLLAVEWRLLEAIVPAAFGLGIIYLALGHWG